ncbi:cytosine permease [Rhodococcus triatomae]|uniref:Cytosine permease n=1 Tax=Rhodococcus triatomae TaxID=300028 RepID=A0A1G8L1U7_9NOCA|nr:cytosine permease [Rhodococcus triatomae]QNG20487.1 cytosine permease [Rhodococcus triatomae]QNG23595.1 cytosine permease [Rhodococcus triatomae]SDI49626.1 cytosine permease [Rhodococcus triatomae]
MDIAASPPQADRRPGRIVDPDFPLDPVPPAYRQGRWQVAIVVAGFLFFTPTMVTAGQVAAPLGFGSFVLAAAAATAFLAVYITTLGWLSTRSGLSTVLLARATLGRLGGKWACLLLGGTQVVWYAITIGILGNLVAAAFGWSITWPVVVVGGIVMAVTAYYGFKGIEILSWISVPLMTVLCVWVLARAVGEAGGWPGLAGTGPSGEPVSMGAAISMMIGTFISGGTQMGNWTRFGRTAAGTAGLVAGAVVVVQFAMLFFGGVGAISYGIADFAELLLAMGLVAVALVLLVANLWTTNDNTAYAFGVAGAELFERNDKRPFVVGGVVLGIVLAISGIADSILDYLVVVGVMIPPLGGVMIGLYFTSVARLDPARAVADAPQIRLPGLLAYLLGVAAALAGALTDTGSPAIQGLVVALVAALVVGRLFPDVAAESSHTEQAGVDRWQP